MRTCAAFLLGVALASAVSCSRRANVADAVRIGVPSTGWLDVSDRARAKVVPALSFTLTNRSPDRLRALQVNAHFHTVDNEDEWGAGFLTVTGGDGLLPGASTQPVMLKGEFGYTGTGVQRMVDQFAETTVELYAKYGAEQWTRLGDFRIERRLLRSATTRP